MTDVLATFGMAFFFSFIGTIPPGTLSLSIIQLGLSNRINQAWRMSLAAAITEYPYAWVAVEFQEFINSFSGMSRYLHLSASLIMIAFGVLNLWSVVRPNKVTQSLRNSGFRTGILLSIVNPLAIPFWIATTAYLKSRGWVSLSDAISLHAYLLGVSAGTLVVFMLMGYLASRLVSAFRINTFIHRAPGVLLIILGVYSLAAYIFG